VGENVLFKAELLGRVGIKKNGKRIYQRHGRIGITTSDNYKAWAKSAALQLLQSKTETLAALPISEPINLKCVFHFPNHHGEADLSNLFQGIEDLLEELGIIKNDKLIYSLDGSRKVFGSKEFITQIEITKFSNL